MLHIDRKNNKTYKFEDTQLSTSKIMAVAIKLILAINKTLPIVLVGRAESFDKSSLAKLNKFAIKKNCVMILDKVDQDGGDIEIQGYELTQ